MKNHIRNLGLLALVVVPLGSRDVLAQEEKKSRLIFCVLATEAQDRAAFDAAKGYLASLKGNPDMQKQEDERRAKGEPPLFADPKAGTHRWVKLGERERRLMGLTAEAEKSSVADLKKTFEEAASAREERADDLSRRRRWIVYTREGKDRGTFDAYLLVRQPEPGRAITDEHLKSVSLHRDSTMRPYLLVEFTDEGKKRFEEFTKANAPRDKAITFVSILADSQALAIFGVGEVITDGVLKLRGRTQSAEAESLAEQIRRHLPKK